MRGLLLDVMENRVEVVEVSWLDDYYRLIGCSLIDITQRKIAGTYYEIICDDEGLLQENPKISAINDMGQPMLVGNLIIAGEVDDDGNLTDLLDADISHIRENIHSMGTRKYPEGYKMLCQVEY